MVKRCIETQPDEQAKKYLQTEAKEIVDLYKEDKTNARIDIKLNFLLSEKC